MDIVTSSDGTRIAYDRTGTGPAVILVGGAFSYRSFPKTLQLAKLLASRFTVINYDRRGRGDSGDAERYAVDRELDDLAALIHAAGGSASLWGWSSGAVLALRAAARGLPIDRLALYEPPFIVADTHATPPGDFAERLEGHVSAGDRSAAVKLYMTEGMGAPRFFVNAMRLLPVWSRLKARADPPLRLGGARRRRVREAPGCRAMGIGAYADARHGGQQEPRAPARWRPSAGRRPAGGRASHPRGPKPQPVDEGPGTGGRRLLRHRRAVRGEWPSGCCSSASARLC